MKLRINFLHCALLVMVVLLAVYAARSYGLFKESIFSIPKKYIGDGKMPVKPDTQVRQTLARPTDTLRAGSRPTSFRPLLY